ncbi:MAG: hypothetical protein LBE36_07390 [Flavobacteriaceae bacterium]|jgi:DNA-binding NarL/FixJ family response regulator|nr:hypothetical protein [Flavobacteriaceae bacterium]
MARFLYFPKLLKKYRHTVFKKLKFSRKRISIRDIFDAISRKDNSFMPVFLELYPDFAEKLETINPNITSYEVEICALLKLGLTTKEIATATNSTYKAIESVRFRIRKKLNLGTDINLIVFFSLL